jgi:hypothetical protein
MKKETPINPIYLQSIGIERKPNETDEELRQRIAKFESKKEISKEDLYSSTLHALKNIKYKDAKTNEWVRLYTNELDAMLNRHLHLMNYADYSKLCSDTFTNSFLECGKKVFGLKK